MSNSAQKLNTYFVMTTQSKVLKVLKEIYTAEGSAIFNFRESVLKLKGLDETDFRYLKSGDCPYGRLSLYGGRVGTYYSISLTSAFYQAIKS